MIMYDIEKVFAALREMVRAESGESVERDVPLSRYTMVLLTARAARVSRLRPMMTSSTLPSPVKVWLAMELKIMQGSSTFMMKLDRFLVKLASTMPERTMNRPTNTSRANCSARLTTSMARTPFRKPEFIIPRRTNPVNSRCPGPCVPGPGLL